ncbi:MAG: yxaD [Actinomycetia bacterium]|nr:yxaD [Actinomycetes bacterium]
MARPRAADDQDAYDVIETEMALLSRALFRPRPHEDQLDRASYLLARTLDISGPLTNNALASILALDATTVTRQVQAMERARLVVRQSDPADGRVKVISLSPEGRSKMLHDQAGRRRRVEEQLQEWSDEERLEIGRALVKLNQALVQHRRIEREG